MPTSDGDLHVVDLVVRYGPITAVAGVSFSVQHGRIVALLGANGAGKSTLLRGITGLVRPAAGTVRVGDHDLTGMKPFAITRRGIAHVPEGRRVVGPLTVEQNLLLAGRAARRVSAPELGAELDKVYALFPILKNRRTQTSGLLSGGQQQMLAIGRGLMSRPDWLLLDEPSMGLAPIVIEEIYQFLAALRRGETTTGLDCGVLLAEQSTAMALDVADVVHVMVRGRMVASGTPEELSADGAITRAYLGVDSGGVAS